MRQAMKDEDNKDKKKKSHTTVYFPKENSEFLLKAIRLRGEQIYGRGSHGKASAYIMKLITKDLKDQGLLEFDKKQKRLVPVEDKLTEVETEITKKHEQNIMEGLS
jgi:hypothetical protein